MAHKRLILKWKDKKTSYTKGLTTVPYRFHVIMCWSCVVTQNELDSCSTAFLKKSFSLHCHVKGYATSLCFDLRLNHWQTLWVADSGADPRFSEGGSDKRPLHFLIFIVILKQVFFFTRKSMVLCFTLVIWPNHPNHPWIRPRDHTKSCIRAKYFRLSAPNDAIPWK